MSSIEFNATDEITVLFNGKPFHSPPAALSVINQAIVRAHTGDTNVRISAANHPLPRTDTDKVWC